MNRISKVFILGLAIVALAGFGKIGTTKAAAQPGSLIKMNGLSSVYYLGADGKRYVFPNAPVYFSWYKDFSGVVTISQSELESYPLAANITMRPGTRLVKITTNPKVYAVEPGGILRAIPDEAAAKALYGDNWNKRVSDVADAFFTNYRTGNPLAANEVPAGSLVKNAGNATVYYFDGTNYRSIANEAAFNANRFSFDNVLTISNAITAGGTTITANEFANPDSSATGQGTQPGQGTGLTVALSASTPASATIPSQASGVVMAKYNFTAASDGAVTLQSLVLKRTGVGSPSEISKVYLYDGDIRLTNGRTVNSSDNTVTFSSIGYTIPAGTTKTLSVVVDVDDLKNAGNHAFSIESASSITTGGATVSGSFPITGNIMSFNTTDVGGVDVEGNNTYNVKVGETNVELGRFSVYVNNVEDAQMTGITLYNGGRDVISNLKLYHDSDLVATGVKNGSYFTFTLNSPYNITKGESVAFTVKGDVGGRDGDAASLYVRYNTDIKVVGKTFGYNLKPTIGIGNSMSMIDEIGGTQKQTINIEAGQVALIFNGPVTSNVAKNSNDVVLMNFDIAVKSAVDVEKVGIIIKDSDDTNDDDLTNAEIVCGNTVMNEWADWAETSAGTSLTDTSVWSINAGETKHCQIRVDIENDKLPNERVSADLDVSNWIFKDANTGDTITDVVPSSDLVGNEMTVISSSLTVTLASTPASQTWVKGSTVDVNGFNFAAGDAKDVKVTALTLEAYVDSNNNGFQLGYADESGSGDDFYAKDLLTSVELYDGTTKVGDTKTIATDGAVIFNTLNWTIPAGQTKKLTVKGVSSNNAPYGITNTDDEIKFIVSSVTAEYDNGTGLDAKISGVDGEADITINQTITSNGTLTIGLDTNTPSSDLIVMNTQGVSITKVKFTSTKEPFTVEKLQVKNGGTDGSDANYNSVVLEYKNEAGATVTNTGYFSSGVINFSSLSIYVPKDDSAVVTLKGNMNSKDGGATNGHTVALGVTSKNFRAVAKSSSHVVTDAGTDVNGSNMFLYESKPAVAFAEDTPTGNLVPGANTLLAKIKVHADPAKDITFASSTGNSLTVQLALTRKDDATADDDSLVLKDENGEVLDTISAVDFDATTEHTFNFDTKSFTVPAGQDKYLYVYGTTTDFEDQGDSIQVWLDDTDADINWGINGAGSWNHGSIIFKGDKFGGTLVKP